MQTMLDRVATICDWIQYGAYIFGGLCILGIICGGIIMFNDARTAINNMYGPRH